MHASTIITVNQNGIVQTVDKNCCKLFGYELDELIGNSVKLIIPPPYKEQHDTYMNNYLETKVPKILGKSRIVEGQNKDGSIFPIRLTVSKIGDGDSKVFIGMIDKMEDKAASITINSSGIIVSCNQNVEEIFGFKANELIGQNVNMVMPNPYKDQHNQHIANYLNGGTPKVIGHTRMMPAKNKNGTVFPISIQVEQLKVGAIQLFRAKLEKVDVMEAVFTVDDNGKVISCNQNFVQALFGYTNPEIVGQNISILVPSIYQSTHSDIFGGDGVNSQRNSTNNANNSQTQQTPSQTSGGDDGPDKKRRKMEDNNNSSSQNQNSNSNQNQQQYQNGSGSGGGSGSRGKPIEYSWKTAGTYRKEVLHKDGSCYPAILEIHPLINNSVMSDTDNNNNNNNIKISSSGSNSLPPTHYSIRIKRAEPDKVSLYGDSHKLIGKYYVIKTVGQGSYGKVKLAIHKETKAQVAIKILVKSKMKPPELERTRRETDILKQLIHPNIACLLEIIETDETMNIVMEYAGRTLLSYVLERSGLGELGARKFFLQILSAIQYCHERKIIHRDIKHQNILLDEGDNCKIIDFGLSNFMEEGKTRSTFCGTPAYAAPEMILGKKYIGPEVDIWSMGVVLYSMITGVFPFENVGDIIKGSFKDPRDTSPECCDLLRKMLQVDSENRYNLDQIAAHIWVKDDSISRDYKPTPIIIQSSSSTSTANTATPTPTDTPTNNSSSNTTSSNNNNNNNNNNDNNQNNHSNENGQVKTTDNEVAPTQTATSTTATTANSTGTTKVKEIECKVVETPEKSQ